MNQEEYNKATPIIEQLKKAKKLSRVLGDFTCIADVTLLSNKQRFVLNNELLGNTNSFPDGLKEIIAETILVFWEERIEELEAELEAIGKYKWEDIKKLAEETRKQFKADMVNQLLKPIPYRSDKWLKQYQELMTKHQEEEERLYKQWEQYNINKED